MKKNAQGRIYYATEQANIPSTRRVVKRFVVQNKKEVEIEVDEFKTGPGYRGVIWGVDGKRLWSDERPKASLPCDPEEAFTRMRQHAIGLGVPVDLWRHGNEFVETVSR